MRAPRWRDVRLRLRLRSRAPSAAELEGRLHRVMEGYLDPLRGGDDGQGWPLGGPIDPSALIRRAQDELRDAALVEEIAIQVDGHAPEHCQPAAIGECYLPRLVFE